MNVSALVGITGGIAAYKAPMLVRLLTQYGYDVDVVATQAALRFTTTHTLEVLSGNPTHTDMWDVRDSSVTHITLADRANVCVIAPATANFIGKAASGIADDLLTTLFLALKCPVLICPSMNVNMYRNPVVQANLRKLKEFGYHVLEPASGWLACGWTGEGRMPEPEIIAERVAGLVAPKDLRGMRVLVTAGPTEEPLDPVRFLTNRSSGKMGAALARRAADRGADTVLVAGPLKVSIPAAVCHVPVRTALEMYDKVLELAQHADVVIKAAAVADFRPVNAATDKLKKDTMEPVVRLTQNPDILKALGERKRPGQILVGFAAETRDIVDNARRKLESKNLDMLAVNDVSREDAGFDVDTNVVRLLYRAGDDEQLEIMSKDRVADAMLDRVLRLRSASPKERS